MKKVIAIFLLLQVISNNAFAEELVKLPTLFTHYFHHEREHKDAGNFIDYLQTHYLESNGSESHDKDHSDEDKNCNLPFNHCGGCCFNAHVPAVGFTATYLTTNYNLYQTDSYLFVSEDDRIESQDLCSIWQPPKIS